MFVQWKWLFVLLHVYETHEQIERLLTEERALFSVAWTLGRW